MIDDPSTPNSSYPSRDREGADTTSPSESRLSGSDPHDFRFDARYDPTHVNV